MTRTVWLFVLLTSPATAAAAEPDVWAAARDGDLARVRALLDAGVEVDAATRYDATPLYFAAANGHLELVEYLLEKGADPNVRDAFYMWTPLSAAAEAPVTDAPPAALEDEPAAPRQAAINWPSFRGPDASGVGDGQGVPTTWDVASGKNVLWKTAVPGLAHSSPVVWGGRVFVTTAVAASGSAAGRDPAGDVGVGDLSEHAWKVLALDKASGEILWERTAGTAVPLTDRHSVSSHANSTPATDGERLVAVFPTVGMSC